MHIKIREWLSTQIAKQPGKMILLAILLFNIVFVFIAALIISSFSLSGTESVGFFEAVFSTVTMILDAGCIQFVVSDIGQTNVIITLVCLFIILIGMVSFTGAVIGYVTNYISNFIGQSNSGFNKVTMTGHTIILNWNTRASEIVNDLLYCESKQKVVVLVNSRRQEIEKEIAERISSTMADENAQLRKKLASNSWLSRNLKYTRNKMRNNITVIVREGNVFSLKQLRDISIEHAKAVIILGNDINNIVCKFEYREKVDEKGKGNSQTIKTLMQVADITAADFSDDNQKIVVELSDEWTSSLVGKIINYKQADQKCNIIPVRVNQTLGQLLSQFSIMPELNQAYITLFSNKGASFFTQTCEAQDELAFISTYLEKHTHAIPLTMVNEKGVSYAYFMAEHEKEITQASEISAAQCQVKINQDYWMEKKNIIILGHNSKSLDIMRGFESFHQEWNYADGTEILNIIIVDDQKSLEKMAFYKDYPFVTKTVAANIYDRDIITQTIVDFVDSNVEDTSVLILSDDSTLNEDIDANALANLVYVQDIINAKIAANPDYDRNRIDVIVEIIDPKHYDVVSSYSVNNVVISNRYISKMITQIGEKEALFNFYTDILSYDENDAGVYQSKEIYVKRVSQYLEEYPAKCTAGALIRAVFYASISEDIPEEKRNPTIVLGYVKPTGEIVMFDGNQFLKEIELQPLDKLLVFSSH